MSFTTGLIRNFTLGALLLCLGVRCTMERPMTEPSSPGKMLPQWHVGQSWRVEYLAWQPSPEKGPVHSPPPPQKNIWRYEVISATPPDSAKVLSIKPEDGKRAFEAVFDPQDLTLRSVAEIVRGKRLPVLENSPHETWF